VYSTGTTSQLSRQFFLEVNSLYRNHVVLLLLCRQKIFLFIPTSTEQNCVLKPAEGLEGGGWGLLHLMLHQTGKFAKVFKKTFNSMSNKQLYILEAKLISDILGVSPTPPPPPPATSPFSALPA
jgi:hypothetical protein